MSKEIIKEEIIRTLESILEQTQTIDGYEGQIPQIELDIVQDNIRHLYQDFIYLDKINQGETMVQQTEKQEKGSSEEMEEEQKPVAKTEASEEEKEEPESKEDAVEKPAEEKAQVEEKEEENPVEKVEESTHDTEEPKESKDESKEDRKEIVEEETEPQKEAEQEEADTETGTSEQVIEQEEMQEADSENIEAEKVETVKEKEPEKLKKLSRAERKEEKKKQAEKEKETKKQHSETTFEAEDLFSQKKPETKSSTLADKLYGSGTSSLYDRIGASKTSGSLSDRLKKKPVKDIKTAIGINEKFLFINELFKGNMHDYNDAIKHLNRAGDIENAIAVFDEMKEKYNWDSEGQSTLQLLDFVERRYM